MITIFPIGRKKEVGATSSIYGHCSYNTKPKEVKPLSLVNIEPFIQDIQRRCLQSTHNLFKKMHRENHAQILYSADKDHTYAFIDNGSDVLAVAHADSVQNARFFRRYGNFIRSPSLDDRLGCAVALDILPKLGIVTDVLITDQEESGNSSAASFLTDKQYKWIVEFDRMGEDVVTYEYLEKDWDSAIKEFFPEVGWGIYTDICEMTALKCCAMNVGIGYQNYHSCGAYASLIELANNLARFQMFYEKYKEVYFEHVHVDRTYYSDYSLTRGWEDDYSTPDKSYTYIREEHWYANDTMVEDDWSVDVCTFAEWKRRRLAWCGDDWHKWVEKPTAIISPAVNLPSTQQSMMCSKCSSIFTEYETQYYRYPDVIFCPYCGLNINVDDAEKTYSQFSLYFED